MKVVADRFKMATIDSDSEQNLADNSKQSFEILKVSDLQKYLRERGVVVGQARKAELVDLCSKAKELGLEFDPDCVFEDREEVIASKLRDGSVVLGNPALLTGTSDLSSVPFTTEFDVFSYLLGNGANHTSLREFRRSEPYTLMQDGYVKCLEVVKFEGSPDYCGLKAWVKPRTRDKDPVTGASYYHPWIILSSTNANSRSSIVSAYCTCKGGTSHWDIGSIVCSIHN